MGIPRLLQWNLASAGIAIGCCKHSRGHRHLATDGRANGRNEKDLLFLLVEFEEEPIPPKKVKKGATGQMGITSLLAQRAPGFNCLSLPAFDSLAGKGYGPSDLCGLTFGMLDHQTVSLER